MSANGEDKAIAEMMERNQRSQRMTGIAVIVLVLAAIVGFAIYFASVAAQAP